MYNFCKVTMALPGNSHNSNCVPYLRTILNGISSILFNPYYSTGCPTYRFCERKNSFVWSLILEDWDDTHGADQYQTLSSNWSACFLFNSGAWFVFFFRYTKTSKKRYYYYRICIHYFVIEKCNWSRRDKKHGHHQKRLLQHFPLCCNQYLLFRKKVILDQASNLIEIVIFEISYVE